MSSPSNSSKGLLPNDLLTPGPDSPVQPRKPYRFGTLVATVENPDQKDQYGSSSVPIYQTATFKGGPGGDYDYSRSGNPTRSHLEHHIAKISSASHAFAVSSGMAALDVVLRLLKPGDEVIAGDDLYGGTNRLLTYVKAHGGVIVHHVDTTNADNVHKHVVAGKTRMVLLESPTNPLLKIADLRKIAQDVKDRAPDAIVVVDNTMMSPYLQRPLEYGADIIYDSGTKYLSGHHDLMAGIICCNREDIAKQMGFIINSIGNALTPFDCFLLLRGVKTLAIRMDRQQATAMAVANMLDRLGFTVYYPGLENHPGREIHERNAEGHGAVLSFTTGDTALSERIVAATRLWGISVSFGCVNSLISMPTLMSHASIDPALRAERGLPEDLIRLCVGIEDAVDLLDDLEHALLEAGAITVSAVADRHVFVRPSEQQNGINRAVEKLAFNNAAARDAEWIVSAPGKVILFGEHAVVHGVTAIAAAVDLRCYGLSSRRDDGKLGVRFADLGDFSHEFVVDDLPWEAITTTADDACPEVLDHHLITAIQERALPESIGSTSKAAVAAVAFLYLYMTIFHDHDRPSINFTVRSSLPVGAGLGSSAAFSTCVASALLLLRRRIKLPTTPEPSRGAHDSDPGHLHISHSGRRAIPHETAEEINRWAFLSEKILHGNPSGIDNSVSVFGGALAYTRAGFPNKLKNKSGMEPINGFRSLRFMLTDSQVPRDTKALVAGVGELKLQEPENVERILNAVQSISDEARRALADPEMSREELLLALSALIDENHAHLVSLGVSHPALEQIREATRAAPYGLSTKLTGAGGGGCAVTLIPDNMDEATVKALAAALGDAKFVPYLTAVGGSGLGVLPADRATGERGPKVVELFEKAAGAGLHEWAEERGRWLYV